jgi:hypothetical protein
VRRRVVSLARRIDLASRVRTEDAGSSGRCCLLGRRGELARVRKVAAVPDE